MKLRITQAGYHDQKGEAVKVGAVITVKGDDIPASLLNKCEIVVGDTEGKTAVVNDDKKADDSAEDKKA